MIKECLLCGNCGNEKRKSKDKTYWYCPLCDELEWKVNAPNADWFEK